MLGVINELWKNSMWIIVTAIVFHFIAHQRCVKVCGNPELSKSVGVIFPTFADFESLKHILIILAMFQTYLLLLYYVIV